MANDPELRRHQEWLGYVQPVGLVVSPPALHAAQAAINSNALVPLQETLEDLVDPGPPPCVNDFPGFCRTLLGWETQHLVGTTGGSPIAESLDVSLPEYGEVLSPTYAVPDGDHQGQWLMLVKALPRTVDLDAVEADRQDSDRAWHASPHARFERLLREREIPIGILWNGTHLRLVYAPRGESSGHLTLPVAAMLEVAGRPILGALHMLLSVDRVFPGPVPERDRLAALLRNSRKYQNEVSTRLAGQVLAALHELLRGFQAADDASGGAMLREVLQRSPQDVYGGLLGTLMRLVFVLYAEERELLPSRNEVYAEHYSVTGLFARLRDDNARHPDTMDQRYGAWARLLTLFRLIHDGAAHGSLRLPARHGRLFDPDTWDFLEGRPYGDQLDRSKRLEPPRVPDSTVYRVLDNLLVLDGERISYRALDVEQIGSVYEAMMGFELRVAAGPSIGVKPDHVVVDLVELLAAKPADRAKRLKEETGCDLAGAAAEALKKANTPDDVVAALGKKASPHTPRIVPKGAMFLQPTDERRRSGSHYTPRSLTQPIVQTTLDPVLKNLGDSPTADQILSLKVCDPAMGSGAFLVEACRYLGDALVRAWDAHGDKPPVPPDEDPLLYARRLVAQRCLYGVDKNIYAVDLAKLSLWLATLARDHPFTFVDHALRHGDSLVGLSREQIASFSWEPKQKHLLLSSVLERNLKLAEESRLKLLALGDSDDHDAKVRLLDDSEQASQVVQTAADLVIAAFFAEEKEKQREARRKKNADLLDRVLGDDAPPSDLDAEIAPLYAGPRPIHPFHWPIEFPEVFSRPNPGFDAFVGNPPFAGKNTLINGNREGFPDWLKTIHEQSHGAADLVAHFFRRAFNLLRGGGTFGLIATNTIAQGDTRSTGLRWICTNGGTIYAARKRVKWPAPGAAVIVSVVHVAKGFTARHADRPEGPAAGTARHPEEPVASGVRHPEEPDLAVRRGIRHPDPPFALDGRPVDRITAFLFHNGGHDDPARLTENADKTFQGSIVLGMGFTFDDDNPEATPISEMHRLIAKDPRNAERIFPYIGGEEVNDSPTHTHRRYVVNFGEMTEAEARCWPDLMAIVETKVKPARTKDKREVRAKYWWRFAEPAKALYDGIRGLDRILVCARHQSNWCVARLPSGVVFSEALVVFAQPTVTALCLMQSRVHEVWARFFGSSMKDDLRYTPSDCFETFPFPNGVPSSSGALEAAGHTYQEFRAALMVRNSEGLTRTYNRFHDPDERDPDILRLRELHDAMDRAVLDAYGWTDIQPKCEFLLDYEDEDAGDDDGSIKKPKKKPWRYRWPDEIRDEVLARLLSLNQARARSEERAGVVRERRIEEPRPANAPLKGADDSHGECRGRFEVSRLKR